jgi:hypothetical protein
VKFRAILFIAFLLPAPCFGPRTSQIPLEYRPAQSEDRRVWVNTATGIYPLPRYTLVREHQTGQVHEREGRGRSRVQGCEEWAITMQRVEVGTSYASQADPNDIQKVLTSVLLTFEESPGLRIDGLRRVEFWQEPRRPLSVGTGRKDTN